MKMLSYTISYLLPIIMCLLLSACATPPTTSKIRYFWPPLPDKPRIEWLASYSSQLDLEMTSARRFKESLVGEDRPILLKRPVEARLDPRLNKLYVSDIGVPAVFVYDLNNNELRALSTESKNSRSSGMVKPIALTIDDEGALYVLDGYTKSILIFNPDESYRAAFAIGDFTEFPVSLTFDNKRKLIFITDIKANKIIAIDTTGKKLFNFGKTGDEPGDFNRPVGITINSRRELIVADSFNARIQIFSESGTYLRSFGTRGDGSGDFQLIKAVAVDPDDNIYVTDGQSNNIKIFNRSGELLLTFGGYYPIGLSEKTAQGGFALPVGIDIDSKGRIAIVDQLNARIQLFRHIPEDELINNVK